MPRNGFLACLLGIRARKGTTRKLLNLVWCSPYGTMGWTLFGGLIRNLGGLRPPSLCLAASLFTWLHDYMQMQFSCSGCSSLFNVNIYRVPCSAPSTNQLSMFSFSVIIWMRFFCYFYMLSLWAAEIITYYQYVWELEADEYDVTFDVEI